MIYHCSLLLPGLAGKEPMALFSRKWVNISLFFRFWDSVLLLQGRLDWNSWSSCHCFPCARIIGVYYLLGCESAFHSELRMGAILGPKAWPLNPLGQEEIHIGSSLYLSILLETVFLAALPQAGGNHYFLLHSSVCVSAPYRAIIKSWNAQGKSL